MDIIRYRTSDSAAPLVGVRDEGQVFGLSMDYEVFLLSRGARGVD